MVKFPRKVKPKDLFKILDYLGFEFRSQRGSHVKLGDNHGNIVVIPVHRNKSIKRGTLDSIILQMGITKDQFLDLYQQLI